jgi:hypothetical protein
MVCAGTLVQSMRARNRGGIHSLESIPVLHKSLKIPSLDKTLWLNSQRVINFQQYIVLYLFAPSQRPITHHMTAVSEGDEIIRIPLAQHVGHRILQFPPPYLHLENENIQNGGHACGACMGLISGGHTECSPENALLSSRYGISRGSVRVK